MYNEYEGWDLEDFDNAKNFRSYQFDFILPFIKGKTAEIGPGTGANVEHYLSKVNTLSLYEPTIKLFQILQTKYQGNQNIEVYNKTFTDIDIKFDTIIYLDVLEHIKEDKKEFLNAYDKLNANGSLIINVPAFNFLYSQYDKDINHYKRYSKKDLKSFLELTKYSYSKLIYYDSIGFFLAILSKHFLKKNYKKNFKKKISIWNSLIPLSKFFDKCFFHSFGKSLIFILQK